VVIRPAPTHSRKIESAGQSLPMHDEAGAVDQFSGTTNDLFRLRHTHECGAVVRVVLDSEQFSQCLRHLPTSWRDFFEKLNGLAMILPTRTLS